MSVEDSRGSWLIFMFLLILLFLELEAPTSSYSQPTNARRPPAVLPALRPLMVPPACQPLSA